MPANTLQSPCDRLHQRDKYHRQGRYPHDPGSNGQRFAGNGTEEHPDHRKLYEYIREGWAEYIPYLGKNEYPAWFGDSFREYAFKTFVPETDFRVSSLFIKEGVLKGQQVKASFSFSLKGIVNRGSFVYFERLPVGFHPVLMQYELADFAFTDWTLQAATQMVNLYQLEEEGKIVQLF